MATIGPTFYDELKAAGLAGLPFAWGADGTFHFDTALSPTQRAAILAIAAAHDPAAKLPDPMAQAEAALQAALVALDKDVTSSAAVKGAIGALAAVMEMLNTDIIILRR